MIVYWVYLNDPDTHTPLLRPADELQEGAALMSGLAHCELSAATEYNLDILNDLTGKQSLELLDDSLDNIFLWGDHYEQHRNILQTLLTWAQAYPEGVWRIE